MSEPPEITGGREAAARAADRAPPFGTDGSSGPAKADALPSHDARQGQALH